MKKSILTTLLLLSALSTTPAFAGKQTAPVNSVDSYVNETMNVCDGQGVGAQCTIVFEGGSVSVGICQNVDVNGSIELQCVIKTEDLPSPENCKNNALGTPSSWLTFGGLAGALLLLRRRKNK